MAEIDANTVILEDYEPLVDLRAAFEAGYRPAFHEVLHELADELAREYRAKIRREGLQMGNSDQGSAVL